MPADTQAPIGEDDLHALVDGRLDPARVPAVERYLSDRPQEAARVCAFAAQRDALRAALAFKAAEPIPARLRIGNLRASRRQAALARGRVAAAAALLMLAGAGLGWTARGTLQATLAPTAPHRLTAQEHARLEATARETDIAAWLPERLGEAMPLPDLAEFGFALDVAWVMPAGGGASAMLRYVDPEGIAVSVWRRPSHDPVPRPLRCADEPGGRVTYTWSDGKHLHAVTAALPRERLRPIALAAKRALHAPPLEAPGVMAGIVRRPCGMGLG